MPKAENEIDVPTPSSLTIYRSDVADMMERAGARSSRQKDNRGLGGDEKRAGSWHQKDNRGLGGDEKRYVFDPSFNFPQSFLVVY